MAKASTRTITFGTVNLPGNPYSGVAEMKSTTGEQLVAAHEQRTANLIALLNTPGLPDADRQPLFDAVYKHLGIKVTDTGNAGRGLNL